MLAVMGLMCNKLHEGVFGGHYFLAQHTPPPRRADTHIRHEAHTHEQL